MEVSAKLKYLRIAPRKVRLVADLIRGKRVEVAQNILNFNTNKSSTVILKLLNQAIANAKNNFKLFDKNLYISKITVDGGPILKRIRPRARGSAYEIQKKTSHITIILDETHARKKASKEKAEEEPIPTGQESAVSEFEEQEPKREKTSASKFGGKQKEIAKPKTE